MERGDISNAIPMRLMFMWEGCLVEPAKRRRLDTADRFVRRAKVNSHVSARVWDLVWRYDFRLDLLTVLGENLDDALHEWVDYRSLPFSNVYAFDSKQEAHQFLLTMPHVAKVFVGPDESPILFGGKTQNVPANGDWEPL